MICLRFARKFTSIQHKYKYNVIHKYKYKALHKYKLYHYQQANRMAGRGLNFEKVMIRLRFARKFTLRAILGEAHFSVAHRKL